jgi:hypothetical protein
VRTDAEQFDWFVGSPIGIRTRVCYDAPSGVHPLTPESVRQRYTAEIHNSALVVWHLPDRGVAGVRAGIDEVAWHDADVAYFETSFCRAAKGPGYVWLTAERHNGQTRTILSSDRYDDVTREWHLTVAMLLERIYPGLTRTRDSGYDA